MNELLTRSGRRMSLLALLVAVFAIVATPAAFAGGGPTPDGDPDQTTQAGPNPVGGDDPPPDGDPDETTQSQVGRDWGLLAQWRASLSLVGWRAFRLVP